MNLKQAVKPLVLFVSLALAGCGSAPWQTKAAPPEQSLAERHNALGLALASAGRYGEAANQFNAALALNPQAAYLHNNLGLAHLRRGADDAALAALETALRLDPAHPQANQNMVEARTRQAERRVAAEKATAAAAAAAAAAATAAAAVPPAARLTALPTVGADLRLQQVSQHVYELVGTAIAATRELLPAQPAPVAQSAVAAPAAVPATPARKFRVEVANGNGQRGLAKKVATRLAGEGIAGARTTNDKPFNKPATLVHYRSGYEMEAGRVAALVPGAVPAPSAMALSGGVDVRVVLGAVKAPATTLALAATHIP